MKEVFLQAGIPDAKGSIVNNLSEAKKLIMVPYYLRKLEL